MMIFSLRSTCWLLVLLLASWLAAPDAAAAEKKRDWSGLKPLPKKTERLPQPKPPPKPVGPAVTDAELAKAIDLGLLWLARHQDPEGTWSWIELGKRCKGGKCEGKGIKKPHDIGLTGLALLAFLGAGDLPGSTATVEDPLEKGRSIKFGEVVGRGLEALRKVQDDQGCFGKQKDEFMYDHALAACAVAEAARLTKSPEILESATKAAAFLEKARNPKHAWRYTVRPGDNDTSITGWCIRALKAAEEAGIEVDPAVWAGTREWLKLVTVPEGRTGYQSPGDMGAIMAGVNEGWRNDHSMTAVGLAIRMKIDKGKDEMARRGAALVAQGLPVWDEEGKSINFYFWHYGTAALFAYDGPSGPHWKAFERSARRALVANQIGASAKKGDDAGCADGSWDPSVDKWGVGAGRVYATAINVLTLEVGRKPKAGPAKAAPAKTEPPKAEPKATKTP